MMNRYFPTVALFITAGTYAGFAIWLGILPDALLNVFGVKESTPAMLTEVRAFYGGVELGIAAVMLILWKQGNKSSALLVGALPIGGSAIGRCIGQLVDGYSSLHTGFAVAEFIGCAACLAGCFFLNTQSAEE